MKFSQTIEIWKKYLTEQRQMEEEVLQEEEPFQKAVKKSYLKKRDEYLTTGPQKTGGAPFEKKPKRSRSKSAPPAGIPVAEENSLEEVSINFLEKIPVIGKAFSKERELDQQGGNEPIEAGEQIKQVSIELPLSQEKVAEPLKDAEIRKLMNAFYAKWDINNPMVRKDFEKALMMDPDTMVRRYTHLAGVDNTATPEDEKAKEIKADNPEDPTAPEIKKAATSVSIEKEILPTFQKEFGFFRTSKNKDAIKSLSGTKITDLSKGEISTDSFLKLAREIGLEDAEARALTDMAQNKKIVNENLSINNVSGVELAELIQNINKFYPYAQEYLKFDRPVSLNLVSDPDNAKDTFGKTAYYNPNNDEVTIFVDKRHPKDMIRSFSHELVHHAQNCRGEFDKDFVAGENYIEENDHLNLMEREAYEKGNMCLRYYESYLKKESKKMSLNEETLRKAIREAIKRVAESKAQQVTEEVTTEEVETVVEEEVIAETAEEVTEEVTNEETETVTEEETVDETSCYKHGRDDKEYMEEEVVAEEETVTEEEVTEETETVTEEEAPTTIRESLNKEKGKLIFDRLVNKWCK
jgi:hypothetical protein